MIPCAKNIKNHVSAPFIPGTNTWFFYMDLFSEKAVKIFIFSKTH